MTPEMSKIAILKANLEADCRDIEKLYACIIPYVDRLIDHEKTIAASYYLNNLY